MSILRPGSIQLVKDRIPTDATLGLKNPLELRTGGSFIAGLAGVMDLSFWINVKDSGTGSGVLVVFIQDSLDNGENWDDLVSSSNISTGSTSGIQRFFLNRRWVPSVISSAGALTNINQASAPTDTGLAVGRGSQRPWGDRLRIRERYTTGGSGLQPTYDIWMSVGPIDLGRS